MAKRRIKKARCKIISLCPRGMNKTKALFKDADGNPYTEFSAMARMRKGAEGLLDILVAVPEHEDAEGDIVSRAVIQDIAHNFIPGMQGSGIDILHSLETLEPEDAHICETFIVQKNDPRFQDAVDDDGKPINIDGAWGAVMKLDNPAVRALYEVEGWHGASMYGSMIVEPLTKADFANALASRLGDTPNSQETDMNEEKMAEMLKSFGETLTAVLTKSIEGLKPKVEDTSADPKVETIEFVGDDSKLEDIETHEEKLFKASLDFSKSEDVKQWKAYILHSLETLEPEDAHICETFIVQKNDPRFQDAVDDDGKPINIDGAWGAVMKLDNPAVRALYEVEGWHGASMYGSMIVEPLTKADFANALASRLGDTPNSQETDMNEEKMAEMLKSFGETLTAVLTKSIEGLKPKVEDTSADPKVETIEFVGDDSKLEDIETHEEKLFKASLDFSKSEDVKQWKAYILKKGAKPADADDTDKGESEELTQAKARVVELEKASKQGTDDVPSGEDAATKMQKGRAYGLEIAKRHNEALKGNRYGVRVS